MFQATMSSSTSFPMEASVSSDSRVQDFARLDQMVETNNITIDQLQPKNVKKKRSLPGNPDPDAEVIALSPKTLLATNRFLCEICNKGFQRDQNLQLHRRGHNLPWKLKQRSSKDVKKRAYVCPEPTCVHHHPSRALGDLTGIKKHFCRKHGEKKFKCEKCSKVYAVFSDWKAHSKTCGTREYRCDCGTLFSRKDSFITHRAFCDALAEETARLSANASLINPTAIQPFRVLNPQDPSLPLFPFSDPPLTDTAALPYRHAAWDTPQNPHDNSYHHRLQPPVPLQPPPPATSKCLSASPLAALYLSSTQPAASAHMSATELLQKACTVGHVISTTSNGIGVMDRQFVLGPLCQVASSEFVGMRPEDLTTWQKSDSLTRDFLGLTGDHYGSGGGCGGGDGRGGDAVDVGLNAEDLLKFKAGLEYTSTPVYERGPSMLKPHGFGFPEPAAWGDC
ncbi:hypothetical protein Nepgr_004231 [Nepenthes gracilis]|uniref:C2H2-type domain-containing protein n=1 Tax=Nepenthes gracilis TaxID=150966 RepID=A0AAD3S149_NEPGR|nr:hypothetical protein Nepgr_004231 [Nepenthes gracilis]